MANSGVTYLATMTLIFDKKTLWGQVVQYLSCIQKIGSHVITIIPQKPKLSFSAVFHPCPVLCGSSHNAVHAKR